MMSKSKPLFVLIGMTGAGKSTVSSFITDKLGVKRIKTTTTRPQRDAKDTEYVFTTADQFLKEEGRYLAVRKYRALLEGAPKDYYYGVDGNSLGNGGLLITDFDGLQALVERNIDVVGIYLHADTETRLKRAEKRPGFSLLEFNRRNDDDLEKFNIKRLVEFGKEHRLYLVDNGDDNVDKVCEKVEVILRNYM